MFDASAKKRVDVMGLSMAYVENGSGDPIVFLHGNPTSSFLWRNIIPHVHGLGRCVAPDLIGMGDSQKLPHSGPDAYTFAEHRSYLDAFFEALDVAERVTLVVHDWGSALGFDWARRHPDAVRGVVHMEAIVAPMQWRDMPEAAQARFRGVRSSAGEELVLQQNMFIEQSIVKGTLRSYSPSEMDEYRRPYITAGEARRPMLAWARQLPLGGEPPEVVKIVEDYGRWLAGTDTPKLYIRAKPGTHSPTLIAQIMSWPNQTQVDVQGIHYPQEDAPQEIGAAIASWLRGLPPK